MLLMFQDRLYGLWRNAHITVLPWAPTKLLEFLLRVRQPAISSSNSARGQASLVSTTSVQRANSFVFSAVTGTTTACSENPQSELLTMWGRYPHRRIDTSPHRSNDKEFLATDPQAWVKVPVLLDFVSNGSGTGSTQPREYNWGATW
jgi:hypothetical protein